MSPRKQAAQIANAQKSHGPATEAGRARSSQNSIRHSLCSKKYFITPEDRPEFDLYYNDLIECLAPEGAAEALLAEAIIMDEWRLTRARQVENQIFCRGYMSTKPEDQFISGAETWLAHSKELATLTLYEQRINRVLTRNKADFDSKQAARRGGGAGVLACGTPVPHPGALSTTPGQSPEAYEIPNQPAGSTLATGAPQTDAGFVHSSAIDSPAPDLQPATPVAAAPEIAAPEPGVGFVHSSQPDAPTPDPQPLTPAAKPPRPVGFVRSSAPVVAVEEPLAPPADPEPASTPPMTARRAA
jgi:hypothetical protein